MATGDIPPRLKKSMKAFDVNHAKLALKKILKALTDPRNVAKLEEGRKQGKRDVLSHMQYVFPIQTEILAEAISDFGFPRNGDGVIQFTLAVKRLENDDEIKKLNALLKTQFLPQLPIIQGAIRVGRFCNVVVFGRKNLLLTNAVISAALGALGDCIEQRCSLLTKSQKARNYESQKYVWRRTLHMGTSGLTTGVLTHYWYILLDKFLGSKQNIKLVCIKVLVDQVILSPINLCVYFLTLGACERSSLSRIKDEIIEKGMQQIYVVEWFVWPPAQFFNFYILPLRYRLAWDNLISLGFDIYSPFVKYKTELKKEKASREAV